MSDILGIYAGNPYSSAFLVIDEQLAEEIAENRLGKRIKHKSLFPSYCIEWFFSEFGINLKEITNVTAFGNHNANLRSQKKYYFTSYSI